MKHLKKLFVLTMAVALVVVIAPGLFAEDVEKISEEAVKININKASVDELLELKFALGAQVHRSQICRAYCAVQDGTRTL
jgi:hypothetical protein